MPAHTLRDVFRHGLGEIYDAEQQVLALLDQLETETGSDDTRDRIRRHREETRRQIDNLERCFELIGTDAPRVQSAVARGIREAKRSFQESQAPSPPALEAYNLATTSAVEHYGAAAYRTLVAQARALQNDDARRLLEQNLKLEAEMAQWAEESHLRILDGMLVRR